MKTCPRLLALLPVLAVGLVGCKNPTGPTLNDVLAHQARWSAEGITAYSIDYEEGGFFICCIEGQQLKLQVRNDTVVSAIFAATAAPVPGCPSACPGRTISGLFSFAAWAVREQRLGAIEFDPILHYPTRIVIAGGPDASGSVFVTHLQRAP